MKTITVRDTEAPAITSASVDKPLLWPPEHQMVDVLVSYQVADHAEAHRSSTEIGAKLFIVD